jgi:hypothetical protein
MAALFDLQVRYFCHCGIPPDLRERIPPDLRERIHPGFGWKAIFTEAISEGKGNSNFKSHDIYSVGGRLLLPRFARDTGREVRSLQ